MIFTISIAISANTRKKDACISQFTPGGGSDFCAAHKISSPREAYEPARNFVKYKK